MSIPIPDWRITLDGVDLSPKLRPRLVSLTLTDRRGNDADQLDIVLEDSDGRLAMPKPGALLHLQLGWKQGIGVKVGLVDKGSFKVDDVEHSGPPDTIVIRARSADFTSDLRTRREKSWKGTTIGAVVRDIASRNNLTPRCAPALASIAVDLVAQSRESDMAMLRRLGREHDAVATIKAGALIFAPIGAGVTASGQPLPALALRRRDGDRHSFRIEKREEAEGVTASWHDRQEAKRKHVTVGKAEGARKLSRVFPTEDAANRAASSAKRRAARQPVSLDLTLAFGQPDVFPEQRASVFGFKAEIDTINWLLVEVMHALNNRGYITTLKMERAPG